MEPMIVVALIGGGVSILGFLIQRGSKFSRDEHAVTNAQNEINTTLITAVLEAVNINEIRQVRANGKLEKKLDNLGDDFRVHLEEGHS